VLPAEHSDLTMHGLKSAAGFIQSEIAEEITARRLPRLSFRLDESLKKQATLDQAIADQPAPPGGRPLNDTHNEQLTTDN
jgi:ribosome-binding factor A